MLRSATSGAARPWPRHLHLLDNDFFGQPEDQWRARIAEIRGGGFRASFTQGVNVRALTEETAAALASVHYTDDQFKVRRLYCAWDNIGDERAFFRGVELLAAAGVPPSHLLAYMLVGYDRRGPGAACCIGSTRWRTWASARSRWCTATAAAGCRRVMPMPGSRAGHGEQFQRWAVRRLYTVAPFSEYDPGCRITASAQ